MLAPKLDMDMSWNFIEDVMIKVGFHRQFVDLVMAYIQEPGLVVLVNGSPTDWFKSTIGLRQRDPLSPYQFIIGAEAFVRRIKAAQGIEKLSGIKVGTVRDINDNTCLM